MHEGCFDLVAEFRPQAHIFYCNSICVFFSLTPCRHTFIISQDEDRRLRKLPWKLTYPFLRSFVLTKRSRLKKWIHDTLSTSIHVLSHIFEESIPHFLARNTNHFFRELTSPGVMIQVLHWVEFKGIFFQKGFRSLPLAFWVLFQRSKKIIEKLLHRTLKEHCHIQEWQRERSDCSTAFSAFNTALWKYCYFGFPNGNIFLYFS